MTRFVRAVLVAACLAAGLAGAETQQASRTEGHPMIGSAAPEFELKTVAGDTLRLRDLRGKYVVIHFGASW